ncbi:MAG: hypothetical protein AAF738_06800, partial [Bacteroidota bacterium]
MIEVIEQQAFALEDVHIECNVSPNGIFALDGLFSSISNSARGGTWSLVTTGTTTRVVAATLDYTTAGCYQVRYTPPTVSNCGVAPMDAFVCVSEQPQPSFDTESWICVEPADGAQTLDPSLNSPTYGSTVMRTWTIQDNMLNADATVDASTGIVTVTPTGGDVSGSYTLTLAETIDYAACGTNPAGSCMEEFAVTVMGMSNCTSTDTGSGGGTNTNVFDENPCCEETMQMTPVNVNFDDLAIVVGGISMGELETGCSEPLEYTISFVSTGGDIPNLSSTGERLNISYSGGLNGTSEMTYRFSQSVDVTLSSRSNDPAESITFITPYDMIVPGVGSMIETAPGVMPVVWNNGNEGTSYTDFIFNDVTEITLGLEGNNLTQQQRLAFSNYKTGVELCPEECIVGDDKDGDGVPDCYDADIDNDCILNSQECMGGAVMNMNNTDFPRFATGQGTVGGQDPNWEVDWVTPTSAYAATPTSNAGYSLQTFAPGDAFGFVPATIVGQLFGGWTTPVAGADWIAYDFPGTNNGAGIHNDADLDGINGESSGPNDAPTNPATGDAVRLVFRNTIDIPSSCLANTFSLDAVISVDNIIPTILVNGVETAPPPIGFNTSATVSLTEGWQCGTNTVEIIVESGPGLVGFYIGPPTATCSTCADTDGDGLTNQYDLDSDNDGIPDAVEACGNINLALENCSLDINGDATYVMDAEGCNTGAIMGAGCATLNDTDLDGVPDYIDLDSDDDGCSDANEGGTADNMGVNTDVYANPAARVENCGLVASATGGVCMIPTTTAWLEQCTQAGCSDKDGDGIADSVDQDDDNDGIPDCTEKGLENATLASLFNITGSASAVSAMEVQLTPATNGQAGSIMSNNIINFEEDFEFDVEVYLGNNDGGADGMAIVFHNDPAGSNALGAA